MSSIFIIIFIKLKNSCTSNLAAILIDLVLKRQQHILKIKYRASCVRTALREINRNIAISESK